MKLPSPRGGELKSFRENRGREAVPQRSLREPAAHAVRTAAKYFQNLREAAPRPHRELPRRISPLRPFHTYFTAILRNRALAVPALYNYENLSFSA